MTQTHWDDVSHWNPKFKPDRAICAKATQGTGFKDPMFMQFMKLAAEGNHNGFAYHFMEVGKGDAQAKFAHSVIGNRPTMLDVEDYKPSSVAKDNVCASLADVELFAKTYAGLKGVFHVLYLPHRVWVDYWHRANLAPLTKLGLHIINADYTDGSDSKAIGFRKDGSYENFALQYTSTPNDMNVANMSWPDAKKIWTGK